MKTWFYRYAHWFFFVWALWLTLEYFAFGPNSYVRLHNVADSSLPQLLALRGNIKNGFFGNWQPQWGCGSDRASFPISYNIVALFFVTVPGWIAYPALMFTQRFIAGLFSFKLLNEQAGTGELSALFGAMWFSMFSQNTLNRGWAGFTTYDGLALPGIPLLLYLIGRIGTKGWRDVALAIIAGAFAAMSAHLAFTFVFVPLIIYWFFRIDSRTAVRFWVLLALCFFVWVLVAIPLNFPSLLLLPDSVRAKYQLAQIFGTPIDHVLMIMSFVRDNLLPTILILVGMILTKLRKSQFTAVTAAIAAFIIAAGFYNGLTVIFRSVAPQLSAFSGERFSLVVPFLLCVGMALTIDLLNRDMVISISKLTSDRPRWFHLGNVVAILAIAIVVCQSLIIKTRTLRDMLDGQNYKNYYGNPAVKNISQLEKGRPPARVATVAVGQNVLPLFPPGAVWANGLESADSFLVLQSDRYRLFWRRVLGPEVRQDRGLSNWVDLFGQQLNLFYPDQSRQPVEFDKEYDRNLLSLANVRYILSPIPISDSRLRLLANPFLQEQLQTATSNRPRRLLQMLRGEYYGNPLYVYENLEVLPRAFWVSRTELLPGTRKVLDRIGTASLRDLRSTAFLAKSDSGAASTDLLDTSRALNIVRYSADEITIAIAKGSSGFLVVTNTYSKFWKAYCGVEVLDVLPADGTFQGVIVPGNCDTVTFVYRRPGF